MVAITSHRSSEERISRVNGADGKDDPIHALHCSISIDSDWMTQVEESVAPGPSRTPTIKVPSTIIASKHVRFSVDESGRAKLQVFEYVPDSEICLKELFYSHDEIMGNQWVVRAQAKDYAKLNKDYRRCLKDVIEGKDTTERQAIIDLIVKASEAGVRGLESSITNLFRAQRKLGVLSVLELQHRMKGMACYQSELQQQTMLEMGLRAKSSEVSRSSRNLALLFAEADAKVLES